MPIPQGTTSNLYQPLVEAQLKKEKEKGSDERRKQCLARGGVWDEATQTCNLDALNPQQDPTKINVPDIPSLTQDISDPNVKLTTPEIITDQETGKVTGVKMPNGETFLGIGQDEINSMVGKYQQERALPAGTNPAGTARQLMMDTQRKIALAAQTGNIDLATAQQAEELGINWREAILSGTSNVIPSAIGYGAAGAAAGLATGGVASIPLAVAGAIGGTLKGFYSGVNSNIKAQKGDLISGKVKELTQRRRALQNYISAANANPSSSEEMLQAFITEKSLIRKDYNTLLKEANEDLSYWGGQDGTSQIIAYEVYFESVEPSLNLRMEQAILKPDPTRAYLSVEGEEE